MPYKVIKTGDSFSVHKLDANNKPTGKALGTYPDKAKADAQARALSVNEKPVKKEIDLSQAQDGDTVTIPAGTYDIIGGTLSGDIVGEEDKTKDYYDSPVEVTLAESLCGPLTFADLLAEEEAREAAYEMQELNYKLQRLISNVMTSEIEDKAGALVALTTEYASLVSREISEDDTKEITQQIVGDNQPKKKEVEPLSESQPEQKQPYIWKEGNTYRWIAAYSNNRQDDEQEIISTESHKEFDEALHKKEWPMPEVYLWHIPYPVGVTDYHTYDESTGFPLAAGHFYPGMEWAAEGILKEKWDGNSHGMPDSWVKYDPNNPKVIIRHRTKEITFLPLRAAANKLAFSIINKEKSMELEKGLPAHKRPEFVAAFGEERVKQMEEALAEKSKEADDAGIVKKETTEPAAVTHAEIAEVLTQIKEMFTQVNTRMDNLEKSIVKEADQFDLMAILKSKSIIGKESAKVDGRSMLGKDMPVETQPEANAAVHPVGLINNLFAANNNWANGGRR